MSIWHVCFIFLVQARRPETKANGFGTSARHPGDSPVRARTRGKRKFTNEDVRTYVRIPYISSNAFRLKVSLRFHPSASGNRRMAASCFALKLSFVPRLRFPKGPCPFGHPRKGFPPLTPQGPAGPGTPRSWSNAYFNIRASRGEHTGFLEL